MKYRIFRITAEGHLKDIAFMDYKSYLEAENVVKGLKKSYKKRKFVIIQCY